MAKVLKEIVTERGPVAQAVHVAGREMKKQQAAGAVAMESPTPERAARANGALRLGQDGTYRVEDSELAKLFSRGALGRRPDGTKDPTQNRVLYEAGERFYSHVYLSGLVPSGTLDPSRIRVDGGRTFGPAMLASERVAYHRGWRLRIEDKLGLLYLATIYGVVINDESVVDVGRRLSGYSDIDIARGVGVFLLIRGLTIVAVECSLMDS